MFFEVSIARQHVHISLAGLTLCCSLFVAAIGYVLSTVNPYWVSFFYCCTWLALPLSTPLMCCFPIFCYKSSNIPFMYLGTFSLWNCTNLFLELKNVIVENTNLLYLTKTDHSSNWIPLIQPPSSTLLLLLESLLLRISILLRKELFQLSFEKKVLGIESVHVIFLTGSPWNTVMFCTRRSYRSCCVLHVVLPQLLRCRVTLTARTSWPLSPNTLVYQLQMSWSSRFWFNVLPQSR